MFDSAACRATGTLVTIAILTLSGTSASLAASSGSDPGEALFPPATCESAACLEGARAFAAGEYARAATRLEEALWSSERADIALDEYIDTLVYAAVARTRNDQPLRAASHWELVARLADHGTAFWAYQATRAYLDAEAPPADRLVQLRDMGAFSVPFPGVPLARLEFRRVVDGSIPPDEAIRRALKSDAHDAACRWLSDILAAGGGDVDGARGRANLLYGFCLPPQNGDPYAGQPEDPSDLARFRRAERLYDRVQFKEARTELDAVDFDALEPDPWCLARFRLGRTHYRLDNYGRAAGIYRTVVDKCDRDSTETPRVRSLYALGRRHYFNNHFKKSRSRFEQILEDYAHRSHADDALMFLGRIARKRSKPKREERLLRRALEEYPEGDMVREYVWETLEEHVKNGAYSTFVDRLEGLDLPDSDPYYYSQGRLLYFRGYAESKLGLQNAALDRFRRAWQKYPFSFYGYLSNLALRDRGADVPKLAPTAAKAPPRWFYASDWDGAVTRRLAALDLHELAARVEAGRLRQKRSGEGRVTDADRWRLAALHHRAGRYVQSHNIPRRQVEGRPWVTPTRGRIVRWRIAFPAPYRGRIENAVRIEGKQRPKARVSPYLPLAIVREESGFDADIESWAGAVGLMQLMPSTAKGHDDDVPVTANPATLRQPDINIRIGVDHLHLLARLFSDHPVVMVTAYNAGMGAVRSWLPSSGRENIGLWVENVPYRQARHYAKRVIGGYAAYQWLAGIRHLDAAVGEPPPNR